MMTADEIRAMRFALVYGTAEQVAPYLPSNYRAVFTGTEDGRVYTVLSGVDSHGWTLDGYVLPRLASGLYAGHEVSLVQVADLLG